MLHREWDVGVSISAAVDIDTPIDVDESADGDSAAHPGVRLRLVVQL